MAKPYLSPRTMTFDSDSKRIYDGGEVVGSFDEVSGVQIKTIKDSDGPDEYGLSIKLMGRSKIRVEQGKDYGNIFELADEIADILKTKVEKTT